MKTDAPSDLTEAALAELANMALSSSKTTKDRTNPIPIKLIAARQVTTRRQLY